jgi:hypothetical protein
VSTTDEVQALSERITALGKDAGTLALKVHRECGGQSQAYGQIHTALNRLGQAVNALHRAARIMDGAA